MCGRDWSSDVCSSDLIGDATYFGAISDDFKNLWGHHNYHSFDLCSRNSDRFKAETPRLKLHVWNSKSETPRKVKLNILKTTEQIHKNPWRQHKGVSYVLSIPRTQVPVRLRLMKKFFISHHKSNKATQAVLMGSLGRPQDSLGHQMDIRWTQDWQLPDYVLWVKQCDSFGYDSEGKLKLLMNTILLVWMNMNISVL